jgi:hypothetical protein
MVGKKQPKYEPNWRGRVLALLEELAEYYWFMNEAGMLFNDPEPDEDDLDDDYEYEGVVQFAYNRHKESCGEVANDAGLAFWQIAPDDFGFSQDELKVLFYTAGLHSEGLAYFMSQPLGKTAGVYWSAWLREKLETYLLPE